MNTTPQPGFYGKLPVLGDFVTRRLPRQFVAIWDEWLQSSMSTSKEQLGEVWLDVYLTSPLWRFGLSPGLCGDSAWAGVLMPSVDKVGRYYPLTLAAPVADAENLAYLFGTAGIQWFEELEQLALSCLEDGFNLEAFDERLQSRQMPAFTPISLPLENRDGGDRGGKFACHVGMESLEQVPAAFMDVSVGLMKRFMPLHSLWGTSGSERIDASLLVCEGLPPIDAFVALLTGYWEQRGWALQKRAVRVVSNGDVTIPPFAMFTQAAPPAEAEGGAEPHNPQAATTPPNCVWHSWGISVVGKRRTLNEDNMIERTGAGLWAVADGMGGHSAGDVASQNIVDALACVEFSPDLVEFADRVEQCLQQVNATLCSLAGQGGEDDQIIGSTVVVLLASGSRCIYQWAGDSRLYRFRGGQLEQLTRDHSLLDDLDSQGLLSPAQLAESARCNIITRAVGAADTLALSRGGCEAQPGDLFLLCSDGLDKELSREEIEEVFRQQDIGEIAQTLIQQAEERGARDNVTVVVVKASEEAAPAGCGLEDS